MRKMYRVLSTNEHTPPATPGIKYGYYTRIFVGEQQDGNCLGSDPLFVSSMTLVAVKTQVNRPNHTRQIVVIIYCL